MRKIKNMSNTKSFLRWCGGKVSILPQLQQRLPQEYHTYSEPFCGGGSLFFATAPQNKNVILADINLKLIQTYQSVRDNIEDVIALLKQHKSKHCEEYYYECRKEFNIETNPVLIAALMLYLNKTCYNAIYRVNKTGNFNVPWNKDLHPEIVNEHVLRADSQLLKNVCVLHQSFTQTSIIPGAFYYFDPPYHGTYDQYDESGFNQVSQEHLADLCKKIDDAKGYFMLSNSDCDFIRQLYSQYNIENVVSQRSVSSKKSGRGACNELIIRNYS